MSSAELSLPVECAQRVVSIHAVAAQTNPQDIEMQIRAEGEGYCALLRDCSCDADPFALAFLFLFRRAVQWRSGGEAINISLSTGHTQRLHKFWPAPSVDGLTGAGALCTGLHASSDGAEQRRSERAVGAEIGSNG